MWAGSVFTEFPSQRCCGFLSFVSLISLFLWLKNSSSRVPTLECANSTEAGSQQATKREIGVFCPASPPTSLTLSLPIWGKHKQSSKKVKRLMSPGVQQAEGKGCYATLPRVFKGQGTPTGFPIANGLLQNIYTSSIIPSRFGLRLNVLCMRATAINAMEPTNLKEDRDGYLGGFGRRKEKREMWWLPYKFKNKKHRFNC